MRMTNIPCGTTDWAIVDPSTHQGATGVATWRARQLADIRVRMVEHSPGYLTDHWTDCEKGHVLWCVEGELHTDLKDGRCFTLMPGMNYQVADGGEPHRSRTARLFIVD